MLFFLKNALTGQLVMKGVNLPTVKNLMGHPDIQTTMIYAHLAPDHLADAVNKLKFWKFPRGEKLSLLTKYGTLPSHNLKNSTS